MNIDSLNIFDSWDPIVKARKAKGLENWSRLQHMAEKLKGKKSSDISFTTCYPGKEGQKKVLGSVEGNLHFLLGYGNPGFHMAPYHWQIIDPNIDDDVAEELYRVKGHPSRPEFWKMSELEDLPEGDLELGMPHPAAVEAQEQAKRESEGIRVAVGAGTYLAVPYEGLVYGEHNGHVYTWDVVKDSFLAAMNPSVVEAMEEAAEEDAEKSLREYGPKIPDMVQYRAPAVRSFDPDVYPLVKSLFPAPSSIISIDTPTREVIYGVVGNNEIQFYDREGAEVSVRAYDRVYKSFDLRRGGDVHPSILYSFGVHYAGLKPEQLEDFAESHMEIDTAPFIVKGSPSPGFDDAPSTEEELNFLTKAVMLVGDTYRLVVRNPDE